METDPRNVWLPEPANVSTPGRSQAPVGNTGTIYGTQQRATWKAGDRRPRQVCDALKPQALWRLSIFGRVDVTIAYGTQANRAIELVRAPVVLTIPGQFTATAAPIDGDGATCVVSLTQATAGARSVARKLADAGGGAVALDEGAIDFWALTASTLTISGVAVAVPALAIVPLVAGSVLLTGSGFQEFEA